MRVTNDRINAGPHRPRRFVRDEETVPTGDVPTGPIPVVLEWVGEDAERALEALAAEHEGSARPTLIGALEGVLENATSDADDETSEDTDEIAGDPADGQPSDED